MSRSIDPVDFYDSMNFSDEWSDFLETFSDPVNRAFFSYVVEEGQVNIDDAYSFLSESETIQERHGDDFGRDDVKDIRGEMHRYISQQVAGNEWNPEYGFDTYFELTTKGEYIAEELDIGGMLE